MMRIVLLGKPAAGADGCWARAASGQATEQKAEDPAAAPASSVMNSRRFLNSASPGAFVRLADAFRQGLREGGYVEGRNVTIEYRWADGQFARLPELAADLVHRQVSLIVATGGTVSARAAKEATATIPILFIAGPNPIGDGLVTSINRPGGNATGVALYTSELLPKRLELLGELLPRAVTIALLVNPSDAAHELETKEVEDAMRVTGQQMVLLRAIDSRRFIRSPRGKGKGHARDLRRPADWQDWQSLQVRRTAAVSQRSAPVRARLPYSRKKSSTAVSASTASGMLWRWERARSSAVCVACR